MTKARRFSEFPRPWYVSLAAVWQDDEEHCLQLEDLVTRPDSSCQVASNHLLIPTHCRHFTVLAVIRINGHPHDFQSMREFARWVLDPIRGNFSLFESLCATFKPFTATVDKVRHFDNGIVLQFECGGLLKAFRNKARALLKIPASLIVRAHAHSGAGRRFQKEWGIPILESMLDDPKDNYGRRAFGSMTRSLRRENRSIQRWNESLHARDRTQLIFEHIHLLVSDEMLSNPRGADEDILIARNGQKSPPMALTLT